MGLPDFLIIGAMKAGTTVLFDMLEQHPQICMSPVKEPHYFSVAKHSEPVPLEGSSDFVDNFDSYQELFKPAAEHIVAGEASTSYLYSPTAAKNIYGLLPKVKLICILRNPVDRAFSHYLFLRGRGIEPITDFTQALALESERRISGHLWGYYKEVGFYHRQIERYFGYFDREQIQICLFEELTLNPSNVAQLVYSFLGVESEFTPDSSIRRNPSGIPRNKLLNKILVKPSIVKKIVQPILPRPLYKLATSIRDHNLVKPTLSPDIRHSLTELYRDDILSLQDLVGRDLSHWLVS